MLKERKSLADLSLGQALREVAENLELAFRQVAVTVDSTVGRRQRARDFDEACAQDLIRAARKESSPPRASPARERVPESAADGG